jgi:GMP synthase (glutamine-hydrolysing)
VILSGSHASVYEVDDKAPDAVFELGVPVLGICYGMQTMAQQLGGKVEGGHHTRVWLRRGARPRPHPVAERHCRLHTPEGHGMLKVWMSHGDKVTEMPAGFKLMASTDSCPIAGMADVERGYYAVQFHPEVTHTVQGRALLERFVLDICGTAPTGSCATTLKKRCRRSASRWATKRSSWACPAVSIRRWRPR